MHEAKAMTTAIVLAAGLSSRFGSLKQLADYRGEPLVRHAARVALAAGCARTIVVIGNERVREALAGLDVDVVFNDEEGLSSSIRRGVQAAEGDDVLLTLGDQPLVTPEHLRALMEANAPIAITAFSFSVAAGSQPAGRAKSPPPQWGPPAFFTARFADELCGLQGDRGARGVIEAHRDSVVAIRFDDAAFDVDYRML